MGGHRRGWLCRLKPAVFQTYGRREGLSSDQVQTVHEDDDGALWIGTNGDGLNRMKDGEVERFGLAQGLTNGHLWSVLRDRRGGLWVGAWSGLFQRDHGQFQVVSDYVTIGGSVTALFEDSQDVLWVGQQTLGGLACWRRGAPRWSISRGTARPGCARHHRGRPRRAVDRHQSVTAFTAFCRQGDSPVSASPRDWAARRSGAFLPETGGALSIGTAPAA